MAARFLARALPLAAALFSTITHASPHALGVVAARQVESTPPSSSVALLSAAEEQLYIIAFEDGKKYNASFLDEVSAATGATATLETDLTGGVIFNGVSIQLSGRTPEGLDVEAAIGSVPGVLLVSRDARVAAPKINVTISLHYDEAKFANAGFMLAAAEAYTNDKVMMQVDKLRAQGYTGKGIRVAIMDNAIDTRHPAMKVDFVTDYRHPDDVGDYTPECISHATACAGLVKSAPGPLGFNTGVAPGVSLGNYILGGCKHGGHSGLVIQSLEAAAKDKVNIMSVSLAYGNNWKFLEATKVFTRVAEAGVLLVFAAGNSGRDGLWRTPETCAAPGVLCVGMLTNTIVNSWESRSPVTIDGKANSFTLGWLQSKINGDWPTKAMPVWANMLPTAGGWDGNGGDGCHELPKDVPDLSKYIVLIRRKLCNEDDMIDRVAAAGAKHILIAELSDAFPDVFNPDIRREHADVTSLGTISGVHGVEIVKALKAGRRVELDLSKPELALKERPRTEDGQQIGNFIDAGSQWGPTFDAGAAVDIAAPGTDIPILAPVGSPGGIYGIAGGTSLAAPLVAGAAAMVMEALGTTDPKIIANALISTSRPVRRKGGAGLSSTAHQGGGLIQPAAAAALRVLVDADVLEFNDTLHRQERGFTLTNLGAAAVTFDLSNMPATTVYSFGADEVPDAIGGEDKIRDELYVEGFNATLAFQGGNRVVVPGNGGKAQVRVTAADPAGVNKKRLPVWSGYVALRGSDGSSLTLPYLGMAGDVDGVPRTFKAWVHKSGLTLPEEEIVMQVHHGMGSRSIQIFLVDAATGKLAHPKPMFGSMSLGVVAYTIGWRGEIEGTKIPAGEYKLRIKALRAFAPEKSTNEADFSSFDTEPFTFKR